mmetsp:Transcript_63616/g.168163  ORF Transcript_63616/g.168163 Transcript_63616/m.168163 type:complete len:88 (+) Transcript_63616:476-739(+)
MAAHCCGRRRRHLHPDAGLSTAGIAHILVISCRPERSRDGSMHARSLLETPWHLQMRKKSNHTLTLDKCTISDMPNVLFSIVHCFIL